jgi:hypothetical protein
MLEILETGRFPAGIWIPGWQQGLLPLTEAPAPSPRAYPIVPRADKAKEPVLHPETANALSEKGLLLYELGRNQEALDLYSEIVRRAANAKEPAQAVAPRSGLRFMLRGSASVATVFSSSALTSASLSMR